MNFGEKLGTDRNGNLRYWEQYSFDTPDHIGGDGGKILPGVGIGMRFRSVDSFGPFWQYSFGSNVNEGEKTGSGFGFDKLNTLLGAAGVSFGSMESIIGLDKSLKNLPVAKGIKLIGRGVIISQVLISGYNTADAWSNSDRDWRTNDGNKWGVTVKSALDVAVGAFSVLGGPVGWAIGGIYFIGDAAGWFDSWGKKP